ncbi:MAG: cytochrome P450 [Myxococcales bacterium]|nr:cytochrome P450 [Myxococcales bacterium]
MNSTTPELDRFDVVSPAARSKIHAVYREMRRAGPIHRVTDPFSGAPAWLVLTHEGANRVLRDTDGFIRDASSLMSDEQRTAAPPLPPAALALVGLTHKDPPEHTRLRALVQKSFTPRRVDGLRARSRLLARRLLDAIDGEDEFDLLAAFAFPLPILIILELLGLPGEDYARFRGWSEALVGDDIPRKLEVAGIVRAYLDPVIDRRARTPSDDLLSGLVHARTSDGERLSRDELHAMVIVLLVAGHESTVSLIANGALALLTHPEQRARLLADPALMRPAIEEMLRFDGPIDFSFVRYASAATELCGASIERGQRVFVSLLAANRDPDVFDAPDRFDIGRQARGHIAFGVGIHACVGAPLARLEGAEALLELSRRRPGLELAIPAEAVAWRPSRLIHSPRVLPVRGR